MGIRYYKSGDYSILRRMLLSAGLEESEIYVDRETTLIMEDKDRIIGFITMRLESPTISHLIHEYVIPEERGKGYGQLLGELFLTLSKKYGRPLIATNIDSSDKKTRESVEWFFGNMSKFKEVKSGNKVIDLYIGEV